MGKPAGIEVVANGKMKTALPQAGVEWFNRGCRNLDLGRSHEAIECFGNALQTGINDPAVHNNLGNAWWQLGRFDEAIAAYLEALRLRPESPEILTHLGTSFMNARLVSAATACLDRAIALAPGHVSAHWNRSLLSLLKGDYESGWAEYEWRWELPHVKDKKQGQLPPRWDGRKLSGEKVLVFAEQGLGDTLQFVRFVPEIIKRGGKPILFCQPELKSLISAGNRYGTVIGTDEAVPRADYSMPLLSLPAVLQTGGQVEAPIPYLSTDAGKVERWKARLAEMPGLKVGIVWAGNARPEDPRASSIDKRRSLRLEQLAPLLQIPGCTFLSLQKGPPQKELADSKLNVIDLGKELNDFSDSAALVESLDLAISVDTSVIHLCGALGTPVWMLSRHDGCWRWLLEGENTPWYSSLKIFRQHRPRDWESVIGEVARELQYLAKHSQMGL